MAEQKPPSVGSILQNIQTGLAVIAGAVALFTATGFVIVNTALAQYTDIFSYRVDGAQYVGAAFSFLLGVIIPFILPSVLLWFIEKTIKNMLLKLIIFLIVIVVALLILLDLLSRQLFLFRSLPSSDALIFIALFSFILGIPAAAMSLHTRLRLDSLLKFNSIAYLSGVSIIIIPSYIYGGLIYLYVPRSMGGGQPAPVYMLWENNVQELQTLLSEPDPVLDGFAPVCVLAELSDGLLIYRPDTRYTIAIRDADVVLAMYDDSQLKLDCSPPDRSQPPAEATPEATPDPNVTITPTP